MIEISLSSLVGTVVWLLIVGAVLWLLTFLVDYFQVAPPFGKIIKGVIVLVGVLILINFLLTLAGHPMIHLT